MLHLCFATFAQVLIHYTHGITQSDLVARIARCVDKGSSYIQSEFRILNKSDEKKDEQRADKWEVPGDKSAISKLLKCNRSFVFLPSERPSQDEVSQNIKEAIVPFISDDNKSEVLLALLQIISKDKYIDENKSKLFESFFGASRICILESEEIIFCDFLSKALLYTIFGELDLTVGKKRIDNLNDDFYSMVATYKHDVFFYENTQTLDLTLNKIFSGFNILLSKYKINVFVENIDPSCGMSDTWIDVSDQFNSRMNKFLQSLSLPDSCKNSSTLLGVLNFCNELNDYFTYLGTHMRPLDDSIVHFVPACQSERRIFTEEVRKYRERLILKYQAIYTHMLFFTEPSI